jgi:UBX domain
VSLRLQAGSQEAGFLSSFTPLNDLPTVIVIRNGTVQLHAHAGQPGGGRLKDRLLLLFGSTATNTPLANTINAATSERPSSPIPSAVGNAPGVTPIPSSALSTTQNPPSATRSDVTAPSRNDPNAVTAPLNPIPEQPGSAHDTQRNDYIRMQKEREQKQKDERERIKQQIKADREERRRLEQLRKQPETVTETGAPSSVPAKPKSTEIRVQVRTFDGSTLRQSFRPTSTIAKDVRPWVDETSQQTAPYNLKLILTPLPNRNIEAGEEEQTLPDLGIKGSCTLVMVPVQGYVESYTGSGPANIVGSAVSGGYNLLSGTAGALFGGVRSVLGYGQTDQEANPSSSAPNTPAAGTASASPNQVRVRSLADQRAEASKRDQQFYNGNSTNFQPRKDEDKQD